MLDIAKLKDSLALPVVGAPLFIVSVPELVIAQCKAGIIGSFPALNARPQPVLEDWLKTIRDELGAYKEDHPDQMVAPYAVNQICHGSNDRLEADLELCIEYQVPIIITSLRPPPEELVRATHAYGGLVFHDVINLRHARKAAEQGVDGLILVCSGAGGHAGTLSPFALLREVKAWFDGAILLSGAIADGFGVAGAIAMGADFAYVGTRFVASDEANAAEQYKQTIVDCAAEDIVYSSLFTGISGNYLKPSVTSAGFDPENLPSADKSTMNFGSGGNMEKKVWKDIWGAGQGVGGIHDVRPTAEIVERMLDEFEQATRDFVAYSNGFLEGRSKPLLRVSA